MEKIVVIGAGQAGAACVARLRTGGFAGAITLIGEEPVPPYQRPPLSKGYLLGEMALERLFLRPRQFYDDHDITLRLGQQVEGIDREAGAVLLQTDEIPYDALVLTTGSAPRRLPDEVGGALDGVHVVRTLADVDAMAPGVAEGKRALIVGGGYIGLEAAAVCRKRGMKVTLIEMGERILGRVAAPETADFFRALHQRHGVQVLENTGLERLTGADGRLQGAVFSSGQEAPFDLCVVGIGVVPGDGLARDAGLEIDNGIKVDAMGRTSDPAIWAAGDCASFPYRDARIRLESVQNAIDQAEAVADNMMGADVPYVPQPWFWSDQYDVKLQIAGLNVGYDHVVTRQTDATRSIWYFRGATLLAVDAMGDPRAYMVGKRLIEAGTSPAPEALADPGTDLKALLRS